MTRLFLILAALTLTACGEGRPVTYTSPYQAQARTQARTQALNLSVNLAPPDAQAAQFAGAFLNSIQSQSIAAGREICGYLYVTPSGQIGATPPQMGGQSGCAMLVPQAGTGIFASYHTHAAYAPGYDSEVPSTLDLINDFQLGLDGYVSTPAGRLWHIDRSTQTARLICGPGCMIADPNSRSAGPTIQTLYDVAALQRRAAQRN